MTKSLRARFEFMNSNLLILTLRQTIGMFFRRMVLSYASLFVIAVGGSSSQIGIINSVRPLAGLVMFPISGYLTDRTGRVKIIAAAGYFSALTMLLYVFAPSWEWIALGALLQGFLVISFPPSSAILADNLHPHYRGIGIATMNTFANTFAMFSPYIAAIVLELYGDNLGMRFLYGLLGLQFIFSSTIILKYLKETVEPAKDEPMPSVFTILRQTYSGVPELLRQMPSSVKGLSVVVLMGFIANGIASPYWVVYAIEEIGLSKIDWGLILFIESVIKVILTIPSGMLADRFSRKMTLLAAVFVSMITLPAMILATNFTTVLMVRLGAAVTGALFLPASTAMMTDYVPKEIRGKVMAAIGRGSVLIGATGGGTGGPGMGYLFTVPVMASSLIGGVLYTLNPTYPWIFILGSTIIQVLCVLFFIHDFKES